MAMRTTSRKHTDRSWDDLNEEPRRLDGFVPIIPLRKKFVEHLDQIVDANTKSSRGASRSCWLPLDPDYKDHRNALSAALEGQFEPFRPMAGSDLVLKLEVLLPEKPGRTQHALHDIATTFADAMRFNLWTTDEKQLGLVSPSAKIVEMRLSKRMVCDGEEPGTRFAVWHAGDEAPAPEGEPVAKEEAAPMPASRRVVLLASCLADEKTPLHPSVVRYYKALRGRFDARTARRLALYEQTRIDVARLDGKDDGKVAAEVDGMTEGLLSTEERLLSIEELDEG